MQFLEEQTSEVIEKSAVFTTSASQKQQKLNISSENLKAIKKIKTNVVKNAKRVKSKALKIQEVAKSTSELQNIDIFDSTLTYENRRFSEIANFLQHLQQCQHLYRKSDLLMLLFNCLWNFVFDIWYDKQDVMNSASLNEWIKILRVDFANVSFVKIKTSKIICMRCDQIFNFKKKLREHVREQHAKKSVNSSSLSIDTVKSVCEIEKRSIVIETFVLQASHILSTTSRSQIAFEITSSTSSSLSIEAFKVVSKSTKNESNQCSFASMFSFSRTLESKHLEFAIQKLESESSLLKISSDKLVCETMKKSAVIDSSASSVSQKSDISIATSKQKFESVMIFETVTSSKNFHLSSSASEIVSESMKNMSTQCFTVVTCSSASLTSQKSFTLSLVFKRSCLTCRIDVSSIQEHYLESSSCHEALRNRLKQQLARHAHQREQEAQKQVEVEKEINSFVSSVCLNLSIATFKIVSESMKNVSNQEVTCVRVICKLCKQSFNFNKKLYEHIRKHEALKLVKNSHLSINEVNLVCEIEKTSFASHKFSVSSAKSQKFIFEFAIAFETIILLKRSNLSSFTLETKSESTKKSTTCRRCKQSFKFNNKLHEHIR